jgi:hypothetical protein
MKPSNPLHQKETEWHGGVYFFEGEALSPDDPRAYKGVRKGRPADAKHPRAAKKRGSKKPKK